MKKIIWIYIFLIAESFLILTAACKKEEDLIITLSTKSITRITSYTAKSGGDITNLGWPNVTSWGVCWSTNQLPTINDYTSLGNNSSINRTSFTCNLKGLIPNTLYYLRSFATNSKGTSYGNVKTFTTLPAVTDIDGHVYGTVIIGTQIWMADNLKVSHYRNGDSIPNITDDSLWSNISSGAYCDYNNTPSNSDIYGKLYNWNTVNDVRNIAPSGFHVPSDSEWMRLINYLDTIGYNSVKPYSYWGFPNIGEGNESGFTALPAGMRNVNGTFNEIGYSAYWWSTTEYDSEKAYNSYIFSSITFIWHSYPYKKCGNSIRCIKD